MDVLETNKQWLINEIEIMGSETSESYPHEQMVDREVVYDLIDQLDEPEKVVIPQFVADWISQAKKWEYSISDSMEHVGSYFDTTQYDKAVYWAKKNQDIFARAWLDGCEIEKVLTIPQFVADWWESDADSVTMYGRESINKKSKLHLISEFHDRGLGDHLSKVEDWLDESDSIFLDLVNGKPYEVEKEKLYYVELIKDSRYVVQASDGSIWFSYTVQKERLHGDKVMFTQREIAAIDPRLWPFAVEVAE